MKILQAIKALFGKRKNAPEGKRSSQDSFQEFFGSRPPDERGTEERKDR